MAIRISLSISISILNRANEPKLFAATTVSSYSCTLSSSVPDQKKMKTYIEGNTEASFLFTTLTEFIHPWRSKKEASLSLECKNGQTFVNFQCNLGHPDSPHIQDGRRKRCHRVKSDTRRSCDDAQAAAQADLCQTPVRSQKPQISWIASCILK